MAGTGTESYVIQDDKSPYVVPFILSRLSRFRVEQQQQQKPPSVPPRPFFIGLNGVQGAGKSVLVSLLYKTLSSAPYNLSTVVFSLDDVYLTHADQVALARSHPDNPLLQHRGQPSTHDIPLALEVFKGLTENKPTKIPEYNKAAFHGEGDRTDPGGWQTVNTEASGTVQVVIFEGWCVGFRALDMSRLQDIHNSAVQQYQTNPGAYLGRLAHNSLKSVQTINEALRAYDALTDQLDAFIHIDAANPQYVYKWRLQQELGLRQLKGTGMTDEQVVKFVDGYYPAYELYTQTLREGVFNGGSGSSSSKKTMTPHLETSLQSGNSGGVHGHGQETGPDTKSQHRQLRLIVGDDRKIIEVIEL